MTGIGCMKQAALRQLWHDGSVRGKPADRPLDSTERFRRFVSTLVALVLIGGALAGPRQARPPPPRMRPEGTPAVLHPRARPEALAGCIGCATSQVSACAI